MKPDIEIARAASMRPIVELAGDRLGIPAKELLPYGHYKAKVSLDYLDGLNNSDDGKLILVTAISPTPAGEGKTTTTVGLGDALNRIGKKAAICLREPSLGPVFGVKGGAAGGGAEVNSQDLRMTRDRRKHSPKPSPKPRSHALRWNGRPARFVSANQN